MRVTGKNRTPYIVELRETIQGIFASYEVIKPDLKYEVLLPEQARGGDSMGIPGEGSEPLVLPEKTIRDFRERNKGYTYGTTDIPLDETARVYGIIINNTIIINKGGDTVTDNSTNVDNSNSTLSGTQQVTGGYKNKSTQTVTVEVNKPEIENWLKQINEELKKNNVQNEELTSAIETVKALIKVPNPNRSILKSAVETVKNIGINLLSSAIWNKLPI